MSSPLLTSVDIYIPDDYHPLFSLLAISVMIPLTTTIVMDIGYIRHRWRRFYATTRVLGLQAVTFSFAWISEICLLVFLLALCNGFVDPRLHMASFLRNPKPLWRKAFFSFGACLHHAGAMLLVKETFYPLMISNKLAADLPVPILVMLACEIIGWSVELKVLYHDAPRWILGLEAAAIFLQCVCFVVILLFVETAISRTTLVATILGNCILFISLFSDGDGASTHEYEKGAEKNDEEIDEEHGSEADLSTIQRSSMMKNRISCAKILHIKNPITFDETTACRQEVQSMT